jgi:hypothetical protein
VLGKRLGENVGFEVFTTVTMKNVFWYVAPCGFTENEHISETMLL